ncbi:hypothetical protein QWZ10_23950 [Paracoccus cavernae]|uniref:Uncharacterized protein n=1 Tax=Paracoccus cavernae TaxID=1571207 RepID=A0ABT8DED7_9RHOB|nr:hypothetical protein [Paracoccus cavernae]
MCQLGLRLSDKGASDFNIQPRPLMMVEGWFQTSAFEAESWPPLAKLVSIAA